MADLNNFTEITENFDTIKTLLNSIRAQGILNTSDVDKLLSGINSKLEKINTEEDIDLIKIFLSELKQNLDERHNVLLSKFGAIESLFSNLLKNSSETLKSAEVKELFDIVATNLSVFSREVVSQKETLSDITLRLDALRSDDSQKREIIKNISVLKNDIERVTNGFDSIVLNLNENFKSVVASISKIDPTENIALFGKEIADITGSFNTILSALQMLDKKNLQLEDAIKGLATRDDLISTKQWISDLATHEQALVESIDNLADKYYKIDNLADKIDASVEIIAGLKTIISNKDEQSFSAVLDKLNELDQTLQQISTNQSFEDFKLSLEETLKNICENSVTLQNAAENSALELQNIEAAIHALDINVNFKTLASALEKSEQSIREHVSVENGKVLQLVDVNTTRTMNEIASNSDNLSEKLAQAHSLISALCEKSFAEVEENISSLKVVVSQIDENNVSANNAIFSNITDRLAMFENSLKNSLEKQEKSVDNSANQLLEQISNIKDLTGVLDYKMDASVIEFNNAKIEFSGLKSAVEDVLALDFVNHVKELKVDLFAAKQELADSLESATGDLGDKFSNDLFGKYELLISKLESTETELKTAQGTALTGIKEVLDNILSSIVDILSYVSSEQDTNLEAIDAKLNDISRSVSDNTLNYIENVRDVVEVIRAQVDSNIKSLYEDTSRQLDEINALITADTESIRNDIKVSYEKLLEVKNNFDDMSSGLFNNINGVVTTTDNLKADFENKLTSLKNAILDKVAEFQQEFTCDNAEKISEIKFASETLYSKNLQNSIDAKNELKDQMTQLIETLKINVENLTEQLASSTLKVESSSNETIDYIKNDFGKKIDDSVDELEAQVDEFIDNIDSRVDDVISKFCNLEESVNTLTTNTTSSLSATLAKILDNFVSLKALLGSFNDKNAENLQNSIDVITNDFAKLRDKVSTVDANIDEDLTRQLSIIETNFEVLNQNIFNLFAQNDAVNNERLNTGLTNIAVTVRDTVIENLNQYKNQVEVLFNNIADKNDEQAGIINQKVLELNSVLNKTLEEQNAASSASLAKITEDLKQILAENIELASADYETLKNKLDSVAKELESNNNAFAENLKLQLDDIAKFVDSGLDNQALEVNNKFTEISLDVKNLSESSVVLNEDITKKVHKISSDLEDLYHRIQAIFEENSLNILTQMSNGNSKYIEDLNAKAMEFKASFEALNDRLDKDEISRMNVFQSQLSELSSTFNTLINEAKNVTKSEVSSISETLIKNSKEALVDVEASIDDKVNSILAVSADISAGELQSMEIFANKIIEQIERNHQTAIACRDFTANIMKSELNNILDNIEKETDVIVKDLLEQMSLLKDFQKDEISKLASQIENSVEDCVFNHISELKSYFDIKSDNSGLNTKLDNIGTELSRSVEDILAASGKLLEASVFDNAVSDMKKANEIIVSSMADSLNRQMQDFIKSNISDDIRDKFVLFDKKFTDAVVDKYEEVKLISTKYNNSFEKIEASVRDLTTQFSASKEEISKTLMSVLECINDGIDDLSISFADLKAEILGKAFDEKLQQSISTQINSIEDLIKEQFGYIEDISELCCSNLPELTEMSAIVKYNIVQSLEALNNRLGAKEENLTEELNTLKSDVITQFINIFNQISFVAEQEEILDFIQEKHSELITILSHIVTTVDVVDNVKDNLAVVDNKVDVLKEDIDLINEKITSIISSSGDIDYVYSLQDLESDIASLRLTLSELKEGNKSKELDELIASTNNIYTLVKEFPRFDSEEFKKDFDALNEDIVSISTRTNKLILASDESYKTLQENLQDFKLVINDLDERTRNFAQEAGLDRIDNKLGAINTMIHNGAKTNQVFNQVFEYLAEWVDNAGAQITAISDKVETLDEIGQIKVMLEDLKAEAEDDSDSAELIEALGNVFDKQARKIASLEAKLDRVIVETTINNKNNKIDMSPLEETLNRFLVAIDDKMTSQQSKIDSLEAKLADAISMFDTKDTAQLTKKVGGMDRQIAKLNKSIEKIASHVVEK